ncbi:YmdB family metallophosphoesterase [Candidatus Falkowbacteria bacterium]|nr:YmdB family metallophosphoesterase [Candidatus Falkowbacteria bacterium]
MFNKKNKELTILFFGDVMGKIGRRALKKYLPEAKKKYRPDITITNVENLAHGSGVTEKTWREVAEAGIDFATGGNHSFRKAEGVEMLDRDYPLIRPANYPEGTPGLGYKVVETPKGPLLIANVMGQLFIRSNEDIGNPFVALKNILQENPNIKNILVDMHAETTSEKVGMGLMFDGQVSAVVGTHTHVPTADCRVLDSGTAYVTDIGMVGAKNSVIGGEADVLLAKFADEIQKAHFDIPDSGMCLINAVLIKIDSTTGRALSIDRLDSEIEV